MPDTQVERPATTGERIYTVAVIIFTVTIVAALWGALIIGIGLYIFWGLT